SAARGDECGDAPADGGRIDDDGGAADDALPLELLDAVGDGRAGEADLLGELRRGSAAVAQEEGEDPKVERIQIDGHRCILAPECQLFSLITDESSPNSHQTRLRRHARDRALPREDILRSL